MAEGSESWDGALGEQWVAERDRFDDLLRPYGRALLDGAAIVPGETVLDVGCGSGDTTVQVARRVGPEGKVVGIDLSKQMLEAARERVAAESLTNVTFEQGDAQTFAFDEGAFDAVVSRFGVMFFADPAAAFVNLARALRPGGRLTFVCWQDPMKNEWISVPAMAVIQHVGLPEPGDPLAPGPFSLADGDRLRTLVEGAGVADVRIESLTLPAKMGSDVDDVVAFFRGSDMAREILTGKPDDRVDAALASLRDALAAYAGPDGIVLTGTAWLVMGRRP